MKLKNILTEKWAGDVEIHSTGEHAGKSVEKINKQLGAIKKRNEAKRKRGEKASAADKEKQAELNFAKRAKRGWKK